MKSKSKLIAIGLDAAEPRLIEKWMKEGMLPNLAGMAETGNYSRLQSTADWLAGSPWPSFYTGTPPGKHGVYHYLQWKSDNMSYERPNYDWIDNTPFWRILGEEYRIIEVDIPLTFPPKPLNGIVISNWASHDRIHTPVSWPANKLNWVIENFGEPPIRDEVGGLRSFAQYMKLKDELILANEMAADLMIRLIESEEFDLFMGCFSSTHRAGHKFWDITNVTEELTESQANTFRNSLLEVYQSCDEAIGRIMPYLSPDTSVLVFSLHGMGANTTLSDQVLPKMLSAVLHGPDQHGEDHNPNIVHRLRTIIPLEWRSRIRQFFPTKWQDNLTAYWRMSGTDWSKTKAFSMLADLQGYIRINLKGREKSGIVEPGLEYDQLCMQIIDGLKTFCDEVTGEPVIEEIVKTDQLYGSNLVFDWLPDILLKWKYKPSAEYQKIVSKEFGVVEWPFPGKNPDGRSGNHRPEGFAIFKSAIPAKDFTLNVKSILDLKPLIMSELGAKY